LIAKEREPTAGVGFPMINARRSISDVHSSISNECRLILDARRSTAI
jgi:hypothetical protein